MKESGQGFYVKKLKLPSWQWGVMELLSKEVAWLDLPFGRLSLQKGQSIQQGQISRWVEPLTECEIISPFFDPLIPRDLDSIVIQKNYAKEVLTTDQKEVSCLWSEASERLRRFSILDTVRIYNHSDRMEAEGISGPHRIWGTEVREQEKSQRDDWKKKERTKSEVE